MLVAKVASQGQFEGGINAFLDTHAEHKEKPSKAPSFTKDDAEYVLKIAAPI